MARVFLCISISPGPLSAAIMATDWLFISRLRLFSSCLYLSCVRCSWGRRLKCVSGGRFRSSLRHSSKGVGVDFCGTWKLMPCSSSFCRVFVRCVVVLVIISWWWF